MRNLALVIWLIGYPLADAAGTALYFTFVRPLFFAGPPSVHGWFVSELISLAFYAWIATKLYDRR